MKLCTYFALTIALFGHLAASKVINCYYGTWANYRQGDGKFQPSNIDPNLCTHISYSFFGIGDSGEFKSLDTWLDLDNGLATIKNTMALKQRNPNLKVIAVVGGWNAGSAPFSSMAGNPGKRATFINTALAFIRQYGFNGLDVDWEYPGQRGGNAADRANFVTLLQEIKKAFDPLGLELSIAVGAGQDIAATSYDIPALSKVLTHINLMTYDYHMASDGHLGFNAPLPEVQKTVDFWLQKGAPASKLVLGIGFYGHTYQLADNTKNWPTSASTGAGAAGPFTGESGMLGYNEICLNKWTTAFDNPAQSPYAFRGNQWVSYDNPQSIAQKMQLVKSRNLAGAMTWSIDTDDFRGRCGEAYPLLKAMNNGLK